MKRLKCSVVRFECEYSIEAKIDILWKKSVPVKNAIRDYGVFEFKIMDLNKKF